MAKRKVINRFNSLTSKEWLPFQKSFFKYSNKEKLLIENIKFFSKTNDEIPAQIYFWGDIISLKLLKKFEAEYNFVVHTDEISKDLNLDFIIIDILEEIQKADLKQYLELKKTIANKTKFLFNNLKERKFLWIICNNNLKNNSYFPFAWDLAKTLSNSYSLKDEKIGCREDKSIFYSLYLRKDEKSKKDFTIKNYDFFNNKSNENNSIIFDLPSWFILKPQPRKKDEILHPAKFPELLAEMYIKQFSKEGDNIFDPMSGTGSTQIAAMQNQRNAYGTELSNFFCDIANNRCRELKTNQELINKDSLKFNILNKDVRNIHQSDFPQIDYIITSPPYWDMLNMKGAENQAKRREKGLQLNYSNEKNDLGNIIDYNKFVQELTQIYFDLLKILKPGGFITIVVKNIKKQGNNYPLAWDLTEKLQEKLILLPETFWCQNDLSIAPYGYGNTWVSNTFHHYCLNFRKPL